MANLIGNVLERNRAGHERSDLIGSLQTTLLAAPPLIDGLDIAVRYEPPSNALGFGADWYDVVALGPHRSALVVGDVAGHDANAAAHMTQIRTTLSDLLLLNTPSRDLFDHANQIFAARRSSTMATIGVVVVDTNEHTLTPLSAGHLSALVVRPSGDVEILTPALRPPIPVAGAPLTISPVAFEPGSTVVMFTDGLIETHDIAIILPASTEHRPSPPSDCLRNGKTRYPVREQSHTRHHLRQPKGRHGTSTATFFHRAEDQLGATS